MVFSLSYFAATQNLLQGLRSLMPVKDPNQIDVAKAAALYVFYRDWHKVAEQMKRPSGGEYQIKSIIHAIKRRTKRNPNAKAQG